MNIVRDIFIILSLTISIIILYSNLQGINSIDNQLDCNPIGRGYRRCFNSEVICYEKSTIFVTSIDCKWKTEKVRTIRYIREE